MTHVLLLSLALGAPPAAPADPGPPPKWDPPYEWWPGGAGPDGKHYDPGWYSPAAYRHEYNRRVDAYNAAVEAWEKAKAKAKPADGAAPTPPAGTPQAVSGPHAAELRAALADAKKLDAFTASRTRYLTLYAVPERDRDQWRTVLDFWVNSLSREAEFAKLRRVTATVFAVVIDNYGWDAKVWEKLAETDVYFHVQLDVAGKKVASLAPWLPAQEAAELVALTQSAAPIVRGDWFFVEAAIQAGRQGTGYFDWLQTKDRNEFDRLVGLDVKESQRVKKEVVGIVARSGVANLPRQIYRFQSITGGYWQTRDVLDDNKNERNALRQLDKDYKHQAEEIYGVLPNGLFAFFLCDQNGVRQDTAPDKIGPDTTAPGRDGRIHPVSCVRCHTNGLREITDWGRRVFSGPISLTSPDPVQHRRLVQLYLGELQEHLEDDAARYAKRLLRLTGWKTEEAAKAVGSAWAWYVEADMTPNDVGRDLGLTEEVYLKRLRDHFASNKLADPVLASHIAQPPIPIRRDDYEQLVPLIYGIVLTEPKP